MKNKLMKPERWDPNNLLAAFTDGVGNPLSKVYSRNQARRLFSKFKNIKICAHECKNSCYLKMLQLFSSLEKYFGFFMVIEAEK
jgi:hypothetical protein